MVDVIFVDLLNEESLCVFIALPGLGSGWSQQVRMNNPFGLLVQVGIGIGTVMSVMVGRDVMFVIRWHIFDSTRVLFGLEFLGIFKV